MTSAPIRDWLARNTPLEPSLLEGAAFDALIAERVSVVTRGDFRAYLDALPGRPDEVDRLIAGVAVPETWLFRYPRSFDLLVEHLRARLATGAPTIRLCSIGCATGQEPFCMAIAALHAGWSRDRVTIEAIDRSPEALAIAADGRYTASSIRGEIPVWAAQYLSHAGDRICIDDNARACVRFSHGDAATWSASHPFDAIFCRNLMIYLSTPARANLLRAIRDALLPGGLLFVGHAEMSAAIEGLRPVRSPHTFALERVDKHAQELKPIPHTRASLGTVPSAAASLEVPTTPLTADSPLTAATLEDARALADAGKLRESEALLRSLTTQSPPSAVALELLGLIRMASNDSQAAQQCFERALYLEPARPASLLQLAVIFERAGNARQAAAYWDRARRASPTGDPEATP
jgi:chemotaxis protein methyltransferase WspC